MNANKEKKNDSIKQGIITDYNALMAGFSGQALLDNTPQLSHGKYIQLSAYEEKRFGAAVTTGNSSIILTK